MKPIKRIQIIGGKIVTTGIEMPLKKNRYNCVKKEPDVVEKYVLSEEGISEALDEEIIKHVKEELEKPENEELLKDEEPIKEEVLPKKKKTRQYSRKRKIKGY